MALYDPPPLPVGYYRLDRVDGARLPMRLPYRHEHCSIIDGDARITAEPMFAGDGTIAIGIIGVVNGGRGFRQIFYEREPFDQLDRRYLTFPGGMRRMYRTVRVHGVVWVNEDEITISDLRPGAARAGLECIFGSHQWHFVRSDELLQNSMAAQDK